MNLDKNLYLAIKNSMLGKYFVYLVQILTLMALSRMFSPEVFGKLVLLQALSMFFQMISVSGLGPAIIYQNKISNVDRDGIFSCSLLIGLSTSLVFVIAIFIYTQLSPVSDALITYFFVISVFFSALSMLPLATLQKDFMFTKISMAEVVTELVTFSFCVILFYLGFDLLALASKLFLTPLFRFVGYYYLSKNSSMGRPSFGKNLKAIYPLLGFAKDQLIFNVFVYFSRNLDTILIAKYFNVAALGYYEKTYQIVRYPLQLFTFAINPALQPVLTKYKNKPELVMSTYYLLLLKMTFIGLAFSSLINLESPKIVFLMFGPQWSQSVPILEILCLTIPLQMILSSTGGVFQAFGATKIMLNCGFFSGFVNVSAIILGIVSRDLIVLCMCLLAAYFINFLQCFYMLHKHVFKVNSSKAFFILLVFSVLPYLLLLVTFDTSKENLNITHSLLSLSLSGTVIFSGSLLLFFVCNKYFKKIFSSEVP